jgi:hypothetical protein
MAACLWDMATAFVEGGRRRLEEFRIADTGGQYDSSYSGSARRSEDRVDTLASTDGPPSPRLSRRDRRTLRRPKILLQSPIGVTFPFRATFGQARSFLSTITARNLGITAFEVRSLAASAPQQYVAYLEVHQLWNTTLARKDNTDQRGGQGHIRRDMENSTSEIPSGPELSAKRSISRNLRRRVRAPFKGWRCALRDDIAYRIFL